MMPFVLRSQFGPNRLAAYLQPYLLIVLPNLLIAGALFFSLAALIRKILPVYVTSVVLLVGYLIASSMTAKLEWKLSAALIDPFGLRALDYETEYWTVSDRNTLLVPMAGTLLWNRIIWLGIAAALFAWTWWRFRPAEVGEQREPGRASRSRCRRTLRRRFPSHPSRLPQPSTIAGTDQAGLSRAVKNVYFGVIVLAGVLFMIVAAQTTEAMFGTETYPVTGVILEIVGGSFTMFVLIIITFYAGELVWRERDAGVDPLIDVLPITNWLPLAAKLLALILVQVVLLAIVMLCCLGIQASQGYFRFEPAVYLKSLFGIRLVQYGLFCVLAITVQVLVNHKYLGHFVMVLFYSLSTFMGAFGFGHNLYHYAGTSGYVYSDMNGFGHFGRGIGWFDAYWSAWRGRVVDCGQPVLDAGSGPDREGADQLALSRLTVGTITGLAIFATLFLALGGYIFYNTNVLNTYKSRSLKESESAEYERQCKHLEDTPQPRITEMAIAADIDPALRSSNPRHAYARQSDYRSNRNGLRASAAGPGRAPASN